MTAKWQVTLVASEKLSQYDRRQLEKMGFEVQRCAAITPPTVEVPENATELEAEFIRLRALHSTAKQNDGTWERLLAVGTELKRQADVRFAARRAEQGWPDTAGQQHLGLEDFDEF